MPGPIGRQRSNAGRIAANALKHHVLPCVALRHARTFDDG